MADILEKIGMNIEIMNQENDQSKDYGHSIVAILNDKGMKEKEISFEDFTENMYVESLSYEETSFLMKNIFQTLFEEFGLLIDYYEEEEIPNRCLSRTLELAKNAEQIAVSEKEKSAVAKMLNVVNKSIECNTCVLVYL